MNEAADNRLRQRRTADVIVAHARGWGTDTLVIGMHGRRGLRRLALTSDAETILRISPIPLLLVRGSHQNGKQAA
jgi:nucleotide-binding universal stress UspA family protein